MLLSLKTKKSVIKIFLQITLQKNLIVGHRKKIGFYYNLKHHFQYLDFLL